MTKSASAKTSRISAKSPRKPAISRSTARNLRKNAKGWKGDDLEEIITIVAATRSRSRF
jgi:hypothetical protein